MTSNDWPPGLSCPRCTGSGLLGRRFNCGCRCDCHTTGFALYNLPNTTIDPIRHDRFPARTVFAHLGADWLAITGPADGSGDGRPGLRLEITPDEIAWRARHGLVISVPAEHFQVWHQALADARRPKRNVEQC